MGKHEARAEGRAVSRARKRNMGFCIPGGKETVKWSEAVKGAKEQASIA